MGVLSWAARRLSQKVDREDGAEAVAVVAFQAIDLDTVPHIQLFAGSKDTLGRGGGAT